MVDSSKTLHALDEKETVQQKKNVNEVAIMVLVLPCKKGMLVSRLLCLKDCPNGLHVRIRWNGLSNENDTLEPIARVYKDVLQLFDKLLKRKCTSNDLATRARAERAL